MKSEQERSESRLVRELKKQIQKLKKELGQLKKRNSRLENDYADFQADLETEGVDLEAIKEARSKKEELKFECPKCGAYETTVFPLNGSTYYKCLSCSSRGKIKG